MSIAIQDNLQFIRQQIVSAQQRSLHPTGTTRLLAVSKTRSSQEIQLAINAGQKEFAENYLQEALEKIHLLENLPLIWHFIGPIQSNKTALLAQHFDWIHTIDRIKIAKRLNDQRPPDMSPLNVLIQININQETSKSGVSFDSLSDLARAIIKLPRLQLRGLMTIPAPNQSIKQQRENFTHMRQEQEKLKQLLRIPIDQLSMGMSADYPTAIEEGATMVRVGTALFGPRHI